MGRITWFIFGAVLFGCGASASFNYRYYILSANSYDGTLMAPRDKDDLPLSVCKPTPGKKGPCAVMLKDAYLKLKEDYLNLQTQLRDCQRGR